VVTLEPLLEDVHLVALPRAHPLAAKDDLTLADLRDETWIEGRPSECTNALLAAAERAGFEPRTAFEAAQWLGKQGLVAASVGVTLIPSVALVTVRDDIVLRSLGTDAPTRCISCDALVDTPVVAAI
jgi:DNA-binding transcriptional LysR family regulator